MGFIMSVTALALSHITYTYPGAPAPLLNDISVTFPTGWTAVMGDNGIGKSTLMNVARGATAADSGQVSPRDAVIAYCPQDVATQPSNLEDFANDWNPNALAMRDALGIDDGWPYRYETLSGGERKRIQIACAMMARPDVLILDEPTNHVDAPTRDAMVRAMLLFTGQKREVEGALTPPRSGRIGIVVSHDIELVDAVAMRCAFFERRHIDHRNITCVTVRPGNYTQACATAAASQASEQTALSLAQKEAARLQRESAARQHDAALAATAWRANRNIDRKDHDARNAAKLAKMTSVDGTAGAAKARLDAHVAAAQSAVDSAEVAAKRYDGDLTAFQSVEPSHRTELVRVESSMIPFDGSEPVSAAPPTPAQWKPSPSIDESSLPVTIHAVRTQVGVQIPTLSVGPSDHIGVVGANGAGKTTTLRTLLRTLRMHNPDETTLVIDQNTTDDDARKALARLDSLDPQRRGSVLSAMAQLNADPDRIMADDALPSPGELRKLLLCLGIAESPRIIVMDEPTNHLDLHSKQALARALAAFPGAVIVASHDMPFLEQAVTQLWEFHR